MRPFSQHNNILMDLDYRQTFVPAPYLMNKLMQLDQILLMHYVDTI